MKRQVSSIDRRIDEENQHCNESRDSQEQKAVYAVFGKPTFWIQRKVSCFEKGHGIRPAKSDKQELDLDPRSDSFPARSQVFEVSERKD